MRQRVDAAAGSTLSVRSFTHLGSTLSVAGSFNIQEQAIDDTLSVFGVSRFGSALAVFDFLHLGSSLALRSFQRLGHGLSVRGGNLPYTCRNR